MDAVFSSAIMRCTTATARSREFVARARKLGVPIDAPANGVRLIGSRQTPVHQAQRGLPRALGEQVQRALSKRCTKVTLPVCALLTLPRPKCCLSVIRRPR